MIEPATYAILTATAVLTGFIDAIAGGGGLIMMPALLFAGVPPVNALATNKLQSMFGTATACFNYGRKGLIEWRPNLATIILVFIGASIGVVVVQTIDTRALSLIPAAADGGGAVCAGQSADERRRRGGAGFGEGLCAGGGRDRRL